MNSCRKDLKIDPMCFANVKTTNLVPKDVSNFGIYISKIAGTNNLNPNQLHDLVLNSLDFIHSTSNTSNLMHTITFFPLLVKEIASKDFFDSFKKIFEDDFGSILEENI